MNLKEKVVNVKTENGQNVNLPFSKYMTVVPECLIITPVLSSSFSQSESMDDQEKMDDVMATSTSATSLEVDPTPGTVADDSEDSDDGWRPEPGTCQLSESGVWYAPPSPRRLKQLEEENAEYEASEYDTLALCCCVNVV